VTTADKAGDAVAPYLVAGKLVGEKGSPSSHSRIRQAPSQIAEDISMGAMAAAIRKHKMWCHSLIGEIVAENSNFCQHILVQYILI
jgi:hypothetical protein